MDPPPPYTNEESSYPKQPPPYPDAANQPLIFATQGPQTAGFVPRENVKITYQIQPRPLNRTTGFHVLKWILSVVLMLEIFGAVMITIYLVCSPINVKETIRKQLDPETTDEVISSTYAMLIAAMILSTLVMSAGVIGVIREHFCTCVALAVLLWISFIGTIFSTGTGFRSRMWNMIICNMATIYAGMLRKIRRLGNPVNVA